MLSFIKHYKLLFLSLLILTPLIVFATSYTRISYQLWTGSTGDVAFRPILSDHLTYDGIGVCFVNSSNKTYFIPNNYQNEWLTFFNKVGAGLIPGVSVKSGCCLNGVCEAAKETAANCPSDCVSNTVHLSYTTTGGGTFTGNTSQWVTKGNSGTAVTAVPDTGYFLFFWSDNYGGNPRTDTNVQADINVQAVFGSTNCDPRDQCSPICPANCDAYGNTIP